LRTKEQETCLTPQEHDDDDDEILATSFGLGRPSSGQNIYKNLNASVYNVFLLNHGIPFTII
jgi:hypothetical protein